MRWKARDLRRRGLCRCGRAEVRPGQRHCLECHRAAMRTVRERQRRLTEMRLRVLGYVVEHGEQSGLPRVREVCEMAMRGIDPFEVLR